MEQQDAQNSPLAPGVLQPEPPAGAPQLFGKPRPPSLLQRLQGNKPEKAGEPQPLAVRLALLSRVSRQQALSLAWLFAIPAAVLCATSATIIFVMLEMFNNFSTMNAQWGGWVFFGLGLIFMLGGGAGAFIAVQQLLLSRFRRIYQQTWQQLESSELPLLVADEVYSLSLLDLVKDQLSFQFSGSPLPRSLEDQLLIAAAYVNALRICQFSSTDPRTPMLREGGRGYLLTKVPARTLRAVGSVSFCVPYISCLGFIWLPFAVLHAQRLCDLNAVQAAFADFFGDSPNRALQAGNGAAKTLLNQRG